MARNILITGGAGFIGSHLTDELISIYRYSNAERILQYRPQLSFEEGLQELSEWFIKQEADDKLDQG